MKPCYTCPARTKCIAACEPGSVMCMVNRMKYTHAQADPPAAGDRPLYCAYCGKPLRVIGSERFCNNVQCGHRYVNV